MFKNLEQKRLAKQYKKAKPLYIIGCWARIGIMEVKWSGKIDKIGNPIIIYHTDYNGEYDLYYETEWYNATTGFLFGYCFNKKQAEALVRYLKENKNELD